MAILVGDNSEVSDPDMTLTLTSDAAVKTCTGPCGRTLQLSSFGVNVARKDGHRSDCKECHRQRRGPRGREGRQALALERELLDLLGAYEATPSLSDVLTRALDEVRQIGATGERRAEQLEAVRRAVLIHGCRRVDEVVEETRLSRWAVDHVLAELVAAHVLETRDAFRLGDEAEEAGRPVVEYHPRAYPRGEGFARLFRRLDSDELEVGP
ncbi:MAG: hypothetical protein QOH49_600 [Acidobacteriota bacterium]|jgi:hypothetical protein|nr:hypothetical protein [Acidobacteriota bacterium]